MPNLLDFGTIVFCVIAYSIFLPLLYKGFKTRRKLKGQISSRDDLEVLFKYANANKAAAAIILLGLLAYLIYMAISSSLLNISEGIVQHYGTIVGIATLPIWILSMIVELPLKKLEVIHEDIKIEERYREILLSWAKPGFRIKK